jgi:histidine triad (HIT) family protein
MKDCLFCKIARGEIPSRKAYEDDEVYAFHDINPQAPTHVLVIPRRHVASLDDTSETDQAWLGRTMLALRTVARELGISAGYRVVTNCGTPAGQTVFHIHFHLLGGRPLGWPPG